MREFANHAILSLSDSTMAVSSKYTQVLSFQIVFFTFSCKWFLCFYFWAVIWSYIVDLFAALRKLSSASAHITKARIIGARALKTLWRHLKSIVSFWLFGTPVLGISHNSPGVVLVLLSFWHHTWTAIVVYDTKIAMQDLETSFKTLQQL